MGMDLTHGKEEPTPNPSKAEIFRGEMIRLSGLI